MNTSKSKLEPNPPIFSEAGRASLAQTDGLVKKIHESGP